jgi:phage terminase large subunit
MIAEFPEKLAFLFEPARYKVLYGGRGGAKSWGIARALLIKGAQRPLRVLCVRQIQASIRQSVHGLLKKQITELGLGDRYEVGTTTIQGSNGTEFIFSGLWQHLDSIKSMEGIDVCWVEEAQNVSEDAWAILIPTIRKAGSEIWISFNPDAETDPTYVRFVKHPPPGAKVVEIGWQDNPWFPEELRVEKDWLYSVDPEAADHVWGGRTRKHAMAQILRGRWRVEDFEPQESWFGPYFGVDWGFSTDPIALVKLWVDFDPPNPEAPEERRKASLYVEHEAWGLGVDVDDTPALLSRVPGSKLFVIKADNARPELISHCQQHGFPRMEACTKGPGSFEAGIDHLRSYRQIVIHSRCKHTAEEAKLWSFKVDRLTGEVLPEQVDKHNHCWDASRYALQEVIKGNALAGIELDAGVGAQRNPWRIG